MSFNVVVVLGIVKDDEILLINRNKYPYVNHWGLLAGKVEPGETVEEAAIREAREETGLEIDFHSFNGSVMEKIVEGDNILTHLLLLVCRLTSRNGEFKETSEGQLGWFRLDELESMVDKMIPNDIHIIREIINKDIHKNFNSVVEKKGDRYLLKEFVVNDYERK